MADDLAVLEQVVVSGDLSKLTPAQRIDYYRRVCESLGLNPLTQPFQYVTLQGRLTLYAKRDATDQLRKIHDVSIQIVSRELVGDVYVVTARATLPSGRADESTGAVCVKGLTGEAYANALMKAETKAKRRVTLSICGLGLLDETEVETVPDAQPVEEKSFQPAGLRRALPYKTPGQKEEPPKQEQPKQEAQRPKDAGGTEDEKAMAEYLDQMEREGLEDWIKSLFENKVQGDVKHKAAVFRALAQEVTGKEVKRTAELTDDELRAVLLRVIKEYDWATTE